MTLNEIKSATRAGQVVCWKGEAYEVRENNNDWYVICTINDHIIGLTWTDEITLNGKEADFYVRK